MKTIRLFAVCVLILAVFAIDGMSRLRVHGKTRNETANVDATVSGKACDYCLTSSNDNCCEPIVFDNSFQAENQKKDADGGDQSASFNSK